MKEGYFIEGHRNKTDFGSEDTLQLDDQTCYPSLASATEKARDYLEKDETLGLIVIYAGQELGEKKGMTYLFRNEDGELSEVDNWWGDGGCLPG